MRGHLFMLVIRERFCARCPQLVLIFFGQQENDKMDMDDALVAPTDLRDFLKSLGWSLREEGVPDQIYLFDNPAFPRRQLVFPMSLTVPDYSESVLRLIGKLAEMLGEQPQVLLERARSVSGSR